MFSAINIRGGFDLTTACDKADDTAAGAPPSSSVQARRHVSPQIATTKPFVSTTP